jgi:hypothetical protein
MVPVLEHWAGGWGWAATNCETDGNVKEKGGKRISIVKIKRKKEKTVILFKTGS